MLDFVKLAENYHLHWASEADEMAIEMMDIQDNTRIEELRRQVGLYAARRFPSLRPEIASEAAHYLIDHLLECSSPALPQKRSIRQTLQACWRIDKWHIIPAVKLHFCLNLVGRPCYEDDAIELIETLPKRGMVKSAGDHVGIRERVVSLDAILYEHNHTSTRAS